MFAIKLERRKAVNNKTTWNIGTVKTDADSHTNMQYRGWWSCSGVIHRLCTAQPLKRSTDCEDSFSNQTRASIRTKKPDVDRHLTFGVENVENMGATTVSQKAAIDLGIFCGTKKGRSPHEGITFKTWPIRISRVKEGCTTEVSDAELKISRRGCPFAPHVFV